LICPKCHTDRAHRSHRRGITEHVASFFGMRPYRCHDCQHRFMRLRSDPAEPERGPTRKEREVQATRGGMRWKRRRRELLLYAAGLLAFLAFLYFMMRDRGGPLDG
jgi:hypothetical protein